MAKEKKIDDRKFHSVDLVKVGTFIDRSPGIIREFEEIKTEFNRINQTLLDKWDGEGSDAYQTESESILQKIGDLGDVLETLTTGAVSDLRQSYSDFDEEMKTFNEDPAAYCEAHKDETEN